MNKTHLSKLRDLSLKNPIRRHLLSGRSVQETAKALKITTTRVYEYANQHNLPTNRPIVPGSAYEKQVLSLLTSKSYPIRILSNILRTTPSHLANLKRKAKPSKAFAR